VSDTNPSVTGGVKSGTFGTRQRLLDAAERLFASRGFDGTSLREVTAEAGANVAAIHYHFGSKEELLRAVLSRIVAPANSERLQLLEKAESEAAPGPPTVEAILEAFLVPDLRVIRDLGERGAIITRFVGRSYTEPSDLVRRMVSEQFGELGQRFHRDLCRAVPGVSAEEMHWRLMAVVAVITYMLAAPADSGVGSLLDPDDLDGTLAKTIAFLGPAVRASPSASRRPPSGV
jgi:AcrR family transcriptional regulator